MFKTYLETIGKDTRNFQQKKQDVDKFKDYENQMIEYINNFNDKVKAFDLNAKTPEQDLINGDIGIQFDNTQVFKVDVKKSPFVSLNSLFKFKGAYYLFIVDKGNYMVAKKDIKKWLTEFSPDIFDIELDNKGNLNPNSEDLFVELQSIPSDKFRLIIMPRSGTPGIKFDDKIFWNTLDKFLNYWSRG